MKGAHKTPQAVQIDSGLKCTSADQGTQSTAPLYCGMVTMLSCQKLTRNDSPSKSALRFGGRLTEVHGQCMLPMGANRMLVPDEMGGSVAD